MKNLKLRLIVMNFLEFAVWGAYLTCMSNYLGKAGMGNLVAWFYAIQGIVSLFMPAIMGIIADKLIQPQRLLGLCHLTAGVFMGILWGMGQASPTPDPSLFVTFYTISVAFFMPTIALANTVAFRSLNESGMDIVKDFPPIRVFGTVGFIATMWFVNCAYVSGGSFGFSMENPSRFQYTHWQFLVSGVLSILLAAYCLTLPHCRLIKNRKKQTLAQSLGLSAFSLFKQRNIAVFFIFSMLLGMCLQVTNGYAGPYITSFLALPQYADTFGARNATLLTSISQISEALCILMIPFFLKRFGIKIVMFISFMAWTIRFGFFAMGNTGSGVWLFIISMIVYGVAFDFFNVSGALFIEKETDKSMQASAQGLFMLMTNGLGATIGTLSAGAIIDRFCTWEGDYLVGDWKQAWYIFAGFAFVVGFLFLISFREKSKVKVSLTEAADIDGGTPDGFVN